VVGVSSRRWERVPGGGSEFQVVGASSRWWERVPSGVGAEMREACELSERLWRGTVSSLAEEERMVQGRLWLWRRLTMCGGRPEPRALNVIVESLKLGKL